MMQILNQSEQHVIRPWWFVGGLIAVCVLLMIYGILGLSLATHPSLVFMAVKFTISGAIALSLGSLGLMATLISVFRARPPAPRPPDTKNFEQLPEETLEMVEVTAAMLEHLKVLNLEAKVGERLTRDTLKQHYKRRALKVHPDRNRGAKAEAEFTELTGAYETLKRLIETKLDPQGLKVEAKSKALDEEIEEINQGFKDLGEQVRQCNQRAEALSQGVERLGQNIEEVRELVAKNKNDIQEYKTIAEQHHANLDKHLALGAECIVLGAECIVLGDECLVIATENRAQIKKNGENLEAIGVGIKALQIQEAQIDADILEIQALLAKRERNQQANNRHRLMAAPFPVARGDETVNPMHAHFLGQHDANP